MTAVRVSWKSLSLVALAGIALASCGVSTTTGPLLLGSPSLNVSSPLQLVSCTTTNACVAVGTTSQSGPTTAAAQALSRSSWTALLSPNAPSTQLTTSSCWSTGCLFAGTSGTGDVVWHSSSAASFLWTLAAPAKGRGVRALNCYGDNACALVDQGTRESRFIETTNGGASWETPHSLNWTKGLTVTSMACWSSRRCLVAASVLTHHRQRVVLGYTTNAGVSWHRRSLGATWQSLSSLSCFRSSCVGLAATTQGDLVVRTSSEGKSWSTQSVSSNVSVAALACLTPTSCWLAGATDAGRSPWLARLRGASLSTYSLRYVSGPLLDVSCGPRRCAAVSATSTLWLLA